jgi:hypothetical protein
VNLAPPRRARGFPHPASDLVLGSPAYPKSQKLISHNASVAIDSRLPLTAMWASRLDTLSGDLRLLAGRRSVSELAAFQNFQHLEAEFDGKLAKPDQSLRAVLFDRLFEGSNFLLTNLAAGLYYLSVGFMKTPWTLGYETSMPDTPRHANLPCLHRIEAFQG